MTDRLRMEDGNSGTCIKRSPADECRNWSKEAIEAAKLLSELPAQEQADMLRRFKEVLGVEKGQYVGGEQPIPKWAPKEK